MSSLLVSNWKNHRMSLSAIIILIREMLLNMNNMKKCDKSLKEGRLVKRLMQ